MNQPWKYFTNSIVINKLIGTKLFISTHQVPNTRIKYIKTFMSKIWEISFNRFFAMMIILSFLLKIFFKLFPDKIL